MDCGVSSRNRFFTLILFFALLAPIQQHAESQIGRSQASIDGQDGRHTIAAILALTSPSGVLNSRAGVNASEPLQSGLMFVDPSATRTGIVLSNPSDRTASTTLVLRSGSGAEIARRNFSLQANQESSLFVDDWFPAQTRDFFGSLAFESDVRLAAAGVRENKNLYGETILAAVPVVDLDSPPSTRSLILPHIAAVAGSSTEIVLINRTDDNVSGTIQLIGPDGAPLVMRFQNGSPLDYEIEPRGVFHGKFETLSGDAVGYAVVTPQAGSTPSANLIFQATSGQGLISEAVVAGTRQTTSARVFVDNNAATGIAIANPNSASATVSYKLLDASGVVQHIVTRELAASGYNEVLAKELFPDLTDGFTGLIDISSATPIVPMSVLVAVNSRNEPVLTALDVLDLDQPSKPGSLVTLKGIGLEFSTRLIAIDSTKDVASGAALTSLEAGSAQAKGQVIYQPGISIFSAKAGTVTAATACDPTVQNPIVCENTLTGNPKSEWDITGIGDSSTQGFASELSVNVGETVAFKINTPSTDYRIDIYRLGYYAGAGARKIATVTPSALLPQTQPACLTDSSTGLIDCGNWGVSASWTVPSTAVSGVYIAKLVRQDATGASHIVFVVRDDSSHSDLLFQTSDTTWQAYNSYGGNSFYTGSPASRAFKISYNRPFNTRVTNVNSWVFGAEYPMIRFLEANGYNVTYFTGIDTDRRGSLLLQHKVFLSVGHDEYWSGAQRTNVETARGSGIHLAFFSGNAVYWKTRWENSIDGSNSTYKTLVCYKETHADAKIDPTAAWTGTWRDPRFSPPADGNRPENALQGTAFMVNGPRNDAITVPAAYAAMRFWRNTSVASLSAGQTATFPLGTLGYEWDEVPDNGFGPAGLASMSSTTVDVSPSYLLDYGSMYGSGVATHQLTLYKHSSGALVYGAGTVQWSWGLDNVHDLSNTTADVRMQQATINILADMRAQPLTLQPGLVSATASTDTTAPTSAITFPANGAAFPYGSTLTITGTAADSGGAVGGVEVSTDGGATWHRASGRQSWSYAWTAYAYGSLNIRSRAVDDSGNVGNPTAGVNITVAAPVCPSISNSCNSLWPATATPVVTSANDGNAVEVGVKFKSDVDGYITAVRFYKGTQNNGKHTANLWSNTGTLLATAPSVSETASGWQQANFVSPVAITAGTVYVASYYTTSGFYSYTRPYFGAGYDNPPLHAIADVDAGGNGVYKQAVASTFPTNSYQASNFWVDVLFTTASSTDTTPPVISNVQSSGITPTGAAITWSTNEVSDSQVEYGTTTSYGSTSTLNTSLVSSHSQQLSSLTSGTLYHYRVRSKDAAGNIAVSGDFTFTTLTTCSCDFSLWNNTPSPGSSSDGSAVEVGMKFTSDVDGFVKAVRFYKSSLNTGNHIVSLWTTSGTLVGQAQATGETASGWQEASFASPVAITANTVYVASYYAPAGHYALTLSYFGAGVDNAPLHALSDAAAGGNGVYRYGAGFPSNTYQSSNYWVDVVFNPATSSDTTPPVITNVQSSGITVSSATISWTTNEAADSQVDYGTTTSYGSTTTLNSSLVTSHSQQLAGLVAGTLYHYRVRSKDAAGNTAVSGDFTFTTTAADTTPPVISNVQSSAITMTSATITWTTNESSDTQVDYGTTTSYGSNTALDSTLATSHSQQLTSLTPGTLYHYRVKSRDAAGNIAVSTDFTFTTVAPDTTPPVISNVQAGSITTSAATITWTTNEASDTQVEYGTTTTYGSSTTLNSSMVTSHSQQLTGLTASTLYHYRVKSKDASGNLAASADFTFTTVTPDTTPPVISNVQSSGLATNAATITWLTNESSTTQVEYGTTTSYGSSTTLNSSLVTSHSQQLTGLSTGTLYHYRVKSKDAAGNTAVSGDFTFTTCKKGRC